MSDDQRDFTTPYTAQELAAIREMFDMDPGPWSPRHFRLLATAEARGRYAGLFEKDALRYRYLRSDDGKAYHGNPAFFPYVVLMSAPKTDDSVTPLFREELDACVDRAIATDITWDGEPDTTEAEIAAQAAHQPLEQSEISPSPLVDPRGLVSGNTLTLEQSPIDSSTPTPRTDAYEAKMLFEGLQDSFRVRNIFDTMRDLERELSVHRLDKEPDAIKALRGLYLLVTTMQPSEAYAAKNDPGTLPAIREARKLLDPGWTPADGWNKTWGGSSHHAVKEPELWPTCPNCLKANHPEAVCCWKCRFLLPHQT
jgi:hypothetical protein